MTYIRIGEDFYDLLADSQQSFKGTKIYVETKVFTVDEEDLFYTVEEIDLFPIDEDYELFVDFGDFNFELYLQENPYNKIVKNIEEFLENNDLIMTFVDFNKLLFTSAEVGE